MLNGEKRIEARLKQDVGMLQEAEIIDIQGLGWARVYNVCNVRSVGDLLRSPSPSQPSDERTRGRLSRRVV
jgi:hypothetical protein